MAKLAELCRAYRVSTIRVYGSLVRGERDEHSDLDLLVEFQPGVDPDLFELGGLQQDLSDLLGATVDLKTPAMFSPSNLQRVINSSVIGYAAQSSKARA